MRASLCFLLAPLLFLSCSSFDEDTPSAGQGGQAGQSGAATGGTAGSSGAQAGSAPAGTGQGGTSAAGQAGQGGGAAQGGTAGSGASSGTSGQGGASAGAAQGGFGSAAHQTQARYFPDDAVWYRDVTKLPKRTDSGAITSWMRSYSGPHGFGKGALQIDFSIVAVEVPAGTEKRTYDLVENYYFPPDCDLAPIPLPAGGAVEETYGQMTDLGGPFTGYACHGFDKGDDCHLVLVDRGAQRLYEVYHATLDSTGKFRVGCLAIWDTTKAPGPDGRGQQCTSADAAGFAMAPMMVTVEEVKKGSIDHTLRLILPNEMIRKMKYVPPATHGTNTSGPDTAPPYGATFRLRPDYPVDTLKPAAQVVARAMQKHGMMVSDGGSVALTFQSDLLSSVKWSDVGLEPFDLGDLDVTDFDVLETGPTVDVTYDCTRTQISQ